MASQRAAKAKLPRNTKPSQRLLRGSARCRRSLLGADDVSRLEPFGPLQQIKLNGLTLVQRTVAVLLNRGEMNEDILPSGPLDEPISFSPVKPLYCTLLSHKLLLSPLPRIKIPCPRERTRPHSPLGSWIQHSRSPQDLAPNKKVPRAACRRINRGTNSGTPPPVADTRCKTRTHSTSLHNIVAMSKR